MAIAVRQELVQPKKYKVKCPYSMEAEYITLHNTYNDASAENEIQYMINNSQEVSYHFAVDDKEVVQGIPTDRNAWAAGDGNGPGNRKSIHIEICYSKSGGAKYKAAEALAIKFTAQLLHERGWGIDRVKKHQDWSGKYCPHRILNEGRWQSVLNAIQLELNELKEAVKVASNKSDIEGHWAEKSLQKAINKDILKGYSDGTYKPDESLTLARFMVFLDRMGILDKLPDKN